jgi:hypothetical protein
MPFCDKNEGKSLDCNGLGAARIKSTMIIRRRADAQIFLEELSEVV